MKSKLVKVSVVVPVYNTQNSVGRCIDSIITQTYNNIEIILVNDGSTDGSLEVLKLYAKKDPRIKVVDQKNSGGIVARKNGIMNSTGDYVLLEDSDDWLEDNLVEKCVDAITDQKDVDIVKFGYISEPSKKEKNLFNDGKINRSVLEGEEINQVIQRLIYESDCNHVWNEMVKKDLYDFGDKIFDKIVHKGEDLQINLQLYQKAKKIVFLKDNLYHYLDNPNGITNRINTEKVISDVKDRIYLNRVRERIAMEKYGVVNNGVLQDVILSLLSGKIIRILANNEDPKDVLSEIQNGLDDTLPDYIHDYDPNLLKHNWLVNSICKNIINGNYLKNLKFRPVCRLLKKMGKIK